MLIALEHAFYRLRILDGGQHADQRYDDEALQHGQYAGIDGRGEIRADKLVSGEGAVHAPAHDADTREETDPNRSRRRPFPVQSI